MCSDPQASERGTEGPLGVDGTGTKEGYMHSDNSVFLKKPHFEVQVLT